MDIIERLEEIEAQIEKYNQEDAADQARMSERNDKRKALIDQASLALQVKAHFEDMAQAAINEEQELFNTLYVQVAAGGPQDDNFRHYAIQRCLELPINEAEAEDTEADNEDSEVPTLTATG